MCYNSSSSRCCSTGAKEKIGVDLEECDASACCSAGFRELMEGLRECDGGHLNFRSESELCCPESVPCPGRVCKDAVPPGKNALLKRNKAKQTNKPVCVMDIYCT